MNCPMCGYLWNAVRCEVCGWRERKTYVCGYCGSEVHIEGQIVHADDCPAPPGGDFEGDEK